jgi:hypothetical protein
MSHQETHFNKSKPSISDLIESAYEISNLVRRRMRINYMDKLEGEFKGVKWKSLNPVSKQIRASDVETKLKRLRKPLHEVYPDSEYLNLLLNKPVDRIKYYNRARKQIR